jgi:phage terminase large subunit-like protein
MVDVLTTATGARRQPLVFEITTAGLQGESIYSEHHDYSEQVLEGTVQDDAWFAYVATIDEGDDWTKLRIWKKANPNLGVSVKVDDLREQCGRARLIPAAQNAFLRLRMDVRTQQVSRWIDLDLWDENAGIIDEEKLRGLTCYGGLDLGAVDDLTAWLMAFPDPTDPEVVGFLARFWCPEAKLHDRSNRYAAQYRAWVRQRFLKTTPGAAIDYDFVREEILRDAEKFDLADLAVDRLFQAHQLAMQLEAEGLTVAGMGQGFISMAAPTKELQHRLLRRKVRHGGNPVLRWMAAGVAVKQDPAGNLKVDKDSSQVKVDGIVAAIMALDRVMRHEEKGIPQVVVVGG